MDYIGSKDKLNDWIFEHIKAKVGDPKGKTLFDACAGSAAVSRYAASLGFHVIACDILSFPRHLVRGSIGVADLLQPAQSHLDKMNSLSGIDGYFFREFSESGSPADGSAPRLYFVSENAKKIDACRTYLEENLGQPHYDRLRSLLLYCLLEAVSRVSNTAGTHGAYLKNFKERARQPLKLNLQETVPGTCAAYQADLLQFIQSPAYMNEVKHVVYIDPPYNQRQYAPNYHLYEALSLYDNHAVRGKTGLRDWDSSRSDFCSSKRFFDFLKKVIDHLRCPLLFLSYSSDGLVPRAELEPFLAANCTSYVVHARDQRRYKADNNRKYSEKPLEEYLFEVKF